MSTEDIRRWRSLAQGAFLVLFLLLGGSWVAATPVVRPLPPRDALVRIDGTTEKIRISREGRGCHWMTVRIDTGGGRTNATNGLLCKELQGRAPLARGNPVTILAEPTVEDYVMWEVRSGDSVLITYDQMHAAREGLQRAHRAMRTLLTFVCLPLFGVIAVYLWKEFYRLIGGDERR
jgi:hypothetical protein